ncbi:MAG: NYN domain-containing protein [Myxococcota bacterium]|jgi:uncharacterized LabA/DUF88 family protein|nr:NYN domain-containing protein [Myxococcota bacterium]
MRLRLFIDFWNFQLTWNERSGGAHCDWTKLSAALSRAASETLITAELGKLELQETRIYAGFEAGREAKLKSWFDGFLDRLPGVRVFTSERHWRKQAVHCRTCRSSHEHCPTCQEPFGRAAEKTIDARIVTDLLGLAWEGAYDVAILVSADKDFVPAVELLQSKNFKVINASWTGIGNELARVCWASFYLDPLIEQLKR